MLPTDWLLWNRLSIQGHGAKRRACFHRINRPIRARQLRVYYILLLAMVFSCSNGISNIFLPICLFFLWGRAVLHNQTKSTVHWLYFALECVSLPFVLLSPYPFNFLFQKSGDGPWFFLKNQSTDNNEWHSHRLNRVIPILLKQLHARCCMKKGTTQSCKRILDPKMNWQSNRHPVGCRAVS